MDIAIDINVGIAQDIGLDIIVYIAVDITT
jgi:hypothetical protein